METSLYNMLPQTINDFTKNSVAWLVLAYGFLVYLCFALCIHRKDRNELATKAIENGLDLFFQYSWNGVELRITHPPKKDDGSNNDVPPSSPPL